MRSPASPHARQPPLLLFPPTHTHSSLFPASHSPLLPSPPPPRQVVAVQGRARSSRMTLPHFTAHTPMFMSVGTQGSVKGLTTQQLEELDCHVILGNTYHLQNRPGSELVAEMGGLHDFINWPRGMLTDSGGFQMVSLLHLAEITEQGVTFQSPVDGSTLLLTPEESIAIQNRLGADIIMALDDVVPTTANDPARFEEATHRTTRWIDRCLAAHSRPHEQNLFGIVQGGLDPRLREISMQVGSKRGRSGVGWGGVGWGGESGDDFWRVVSQCTAGLPAGKPRYVMGIGYPLDIVVCSALGADMFDSVYPTRTARFGVTLVPEGTLKLKNSIYARDFRPLDPGCSCMVCQRYSRAYLHNVVTRGAISSAAILVTYHNVAYTQSLTRGMRQAIEEQRFPEWVRNYLKTMFPKGDVPGWVRDAMAAADVSLEGVVAEDLPSPPPSTALAAAAAAATAAAAPSPAPPAEQ
ncbi:hypothetical protein VOLCADRAFT_55892 [Volvox carteri f. nagariensis]|uniref:Queuine tRNA-ribosyltransferase catalytic subunit 1 n=1 Tax=Volvox carteri f. nagariensis TaxID=3068 RepID=D8TIX3_VOLCA|nr:uncharacterized protein VOLCADRAFT_55892 [Volvox carteri f. nagariensis]EFJ52273.1 hypothetical protein VOLCADRAFT_55892 [Volvox carteri f. nagariensis]|eukprot:XP_002946346.1 hypothetical protein VOLCADRAFT_55892 [Volvox carteri f. nagariensis]